MYCLLLLFAVAVGVACLVCLVLGGCFVWSLVFSLSRQIGAVVAAVIMVIGMVR